MSTVNTPPTNADNPSEREARLLKRNQGNVTADATLGESDNELENSFESEEIQENPKTSVERQSVEGEREKENREQLCSSLLQGPSYGNSSL